MRHLYDLLISWGPLGLLLFSAVESAGIPNPGGTDVMLIVVAAGRPSAAMLAAALAVIGSLGGSVIFYEIMRRGGERLLSRYTSSGRGARFRRWFHQYGMATVFISALLPIPGVPFKAFAACACALGVSRTRFLLVLAAARIPRYLGLAYLGSQLGEKSWPWVQAHTWDMVAVAVFLAITLYALLRYSGRAQGPREVL